MPPVARIGDSGSHGGVIVSGSPTGTANSRKIARVSDIYACPIHGPNPIVSGSVNTLNSLPIARIGDPTACGATITSGSPTHFDEG